MVYLRLIFKRNQILLGEKPICTWQHLRIYIGCVYLILFILGDVREPLNKVKQYVTSESPFFNASLEEG